MVAHVERFESTPREGAAVQMTAQLLTTAQAAEVLDVHPATLATWRTEGRGPRFIKIGERNVRYARSELEAWLDSQVRTGTRETQR